MFHGTFVKTDHQQGETGYNTVTDYQYQSVLLRCPGDATLPHGHLLLSRRKQLMRSLKRFARTWSSVQTRCYTECLCKYRSERICLVHIARRGASKGFQCPRIHLETRPQSHPFSLTRHLDLPHPSFRCPLYHFQSAPPQALPAPAIPRNRRNPLYPRKHLRRLYVAFCTRAAALQGTPL